MLYRAGNVLGKILKGDETAFYNKHNIIYFANI